MGNSLRVDGGSKSPALDAAVSGAPMSMGLDASHHKILVVDDEPSVQGFVTRVLSRKGYQCLTAANASEAITAAISESPDVTITDIRMPGSDGTWLLQQLKERCPEMAVIMLTAVAEATTAVDCVKIGADDFLVKPINMDELLISVERALGRAEARSHAAAPSVGSSSASDARGPSVAKPAPRLTSNRLKAEASLFEKLAGTLSRQCSRDAVVNEAMSSMADIIDYDTCGLLSLDDGARLTLRTKRSETDGFVGTVRDHIVNTMQLTGVDVPSDIGVELSTASPRTDEASLPKNGGRLLSFVNMPIERDGETVGLLHIGSARADAFGDADTSLLRRVAPLLVTASSASARSSPSKALSEPEDVEPAGVTLTPIALQDVVHTVLEAFHRESEQTVVAIEANIADELPLVYADADQMNLLLTTLLRTVHRDCPADSPLRVSLTMSSMESEQASRPAVLARFARELVQPEDPLSAWEADVDLDAIVSEHFGSLSVHERDDDEISIVAQFPVLTERDLRSRQQAAESSNQLRRQIKLAVPESDLQASAVAEEPEAGLFERLMNRVLGTPKLVTRVSMDGASGDAFLDLASDLTQETPERTE